MNAFTALGRSALAVVRDLADGVDNFPWRSPYAWLDVIVLLALVAAIAGALSAL